MRCNDKGFCFVCSINNAQKEREWINMVKQSKQKHGGTLPEAKVTDYGIKTIPKGSET